MGNLQEGIKASFHTKLPWVPVAGGMRDLGPNCSNCGALGFSLSVGRVWGEKSRTSDVRSGLVLFCAISLQFLTKASLHQNELGLGKFSLLI